MIRKNKLASRIHDLDRSTKEERNLYNYIQICFCLQYSTDIDFIKCAELLSDTYDIFGEVWIYDYFMFERVSFCAEKLNLKCKRKFERFPNFYVKTEKIFNLITADVDMTEYKNKFFEEVKNKKNINDILNKFSTNI